MDRERTENRAAVAGKLTDELSFNFMFQDGTITRGGIKTGRRPVKYDYTYQDRRITTGLYYQGKDNGVKATLGYNYRQADGWDHVKMPEYLPLPIWKVILPMCRKNGNLAKGIP